MNNRAEPLKKDTQTALSQAILFSEVGEGGIVPRFRNGNLTYTLYCRRNKKQRGHRKFSASFLKKPQEKKQNIQK